jgi:hypothetical protein
MLEDLDLNTIKDEGIRQCIVMLLNLVEDLKQENCALREENQRLRDELNRLKGEQARPTIRPQPRGVPRQVGEFSSEQERHIPKQRSKANKLSQLAIAREEVLRVEQAILPKDAQFKGYEPVVVQDLCIKSDNVRFYKEKFYSPGEHKTYLAKLPSGYDGEFGPGIRAQALVLYFGCQMTEPKIRDWLSHVGVKISEGQVSKLLIKDQGVFHQEKDEAYEAGLRSSPWQHLDDTATRVDGHNHHCHVVENPLHTSYITTQAKDRLTVIDVLRNAKPRSFRLNAEALGYLAAVSGATVHKLSPLLSDEELDEAGIRRLVKEKLGDVGEQTLKRVLDGAAVAAYHAQREWPVVRLLVCDDARQFRGVTEELGLCWVHEGRHYKKLFPYVAHHKRLLEEFLGEFWGLYRGLLRYKEQPSEEERARLETRFDELFSTLTGYRALDERIEATLGKKANLLKVLSHPEIPLHTNAVELGVRQRVRKRKISFGPRTWEGAKAWDTFMSLVATTKKLGVDFYEYVHDRIACSRGIPLLAELIEAKANKLNLGASWLPP